MEDDIRNLQALLVLDVYLDLQIGLISVLQYYRNPPMPLTPSCCKCNDETSSNFVKEIVK